MVVIKRDYSGAVIIALIVLAILLFDSVSFSFHSLTGFVTLDQCSTQKDSCSLRCADQIKTCNDACATASDNQSCLSSCTQASTVCQTKCDSLYDRCSASVTVNSTIVAQSTSSLSSRAESVTTQTSTENACQKNYNVTNGAIFCKNNVEYSCSSGILKPQLKCSLGCDDTLNKCKEIADKCMALYKVSEGTKRCARNQIYQCTAGSYKVLQACTYGCNAVNNTCNDAPQQLAIPVSLAMLNQSSVNESIVTVNQSVVVNQPISLNDSVMVKQPAAENQLPTIVSYKIAATKAEINAPYITFADASIDFCYNIQTKDDRGISKLEFFTATKGNSSLKLFTYLCLNKTQCNAVGCKTKDQVKAYKLTEGFAAKQYKFIVYDTDGEQTMQELIPPTEVLPVVEEKKQCNDSDGGKKYDVAGYVIDETGVKHEDSCSADGFSLTEQLCSNGNWEPETITCDLELKGSSCKNNACVMEVKQPLNTCEDKEPEQDKTKKGELIFNGKSSFDSCQQGKLYQYYCNAAGYIDAKPEDCDDGFVCDDGVCKQNVAQLVLEKTESNQNKSQEGVCQDPDNSGLSVSEDSLKIKSTTVGKINDNFKPNGDLFSATDQCGPENKINEVYCLDKDNFASKLLNCPQAMVCQEGRCIESSIQPSTESTTASTQSSPESTTASTQSSPESTTASTQSSPESTTASTQSSPESTTASTQSSTESTTASTQSSLSSQQEVDLCQQTYAIQEGKQVCKENKLQVCKSGIFEILQSCDNGCKDDLSGCNDAPLQSEVKKTENSQTLNETAVVNLTTGSSLSNSSNLSTELSSDVPAIPTDILSDLPSDVPAIPTDIPSDIPSDVPAIPTDILSDLPSDVPAIPTDIPSDLPSDVPAIPTDVPSDIPSDVPAVPTDIPSDLPSDVPAASTDASNTVPSDAPAEKQTGQTGDLAGLAIDVANPEDTTAEQLPNTMTFSGVQGGVKVGYNDNKLATAEKGGELSKGAIITTGVSGAAVIAIKDVQVAKAEQNSKVEIENIQLQQGKTVLLTSFLLDQGSLTTLENKENVQVVVATDNADVETNGQVTVSYNDRTGITTVKALKGTAVVSHIGDDVKLTEGDEKQFKGKSFGKSLKSGFIKLFGY